MTRHSTNPTRDAAPNRPARNLCGLCGELLPDAAVRAPRAGSWSTFRRCTNRKECAERERVQLRRFLRSGRGGNIGVGRVRTVDPKRNPTPGWDAEEQVIPTREVDE